MRRKIGLLGTCAMAIALLGAASLPASASASHSVLCKENVSVCPEAKTWPANTYVTSAVGFAGTYAELELPGVVTIGSCGGGKFSGPVSPNKEGPATGTLAMFFFSSCAPEGCRAESLTESAWQWTAAGGGNGSITVSTPSINAICTKSPFVFNCKYSAASLIASFEGSGGPPAYIKDTGTAMSLVGGTGCFALKANLSFRTSVQSSGPFYLTN